MSLLLPKMTNEEVRKKAAELLADGMTIADWEKMKTLINYSFQEKVGEFKLQLKLSGDDLQIPNNPMFDIYQ